MMKHSDAWNIFNIVCMANKVKQVTPGLRLILGQRLEVRSWNAAVDICEGLDCDGIQAI